MAQFPLDVRSQANEDVHHGVHRIADDLAYIRTMIVNVVFQGERGDGWVLIDAGVAGSKSAIVSAALEFSLTDGPPSAIILTHGHFDHVGSLKELVSYWDVPIFAHPLEHPYLNGQAAYPDGDPTVGGGLMASVSGFYPTGPINVSRWLRPLPADGSVPFMPGWRWLHTPGHSPGHVSLFRDADRALIAGDAFVTTKQESAYAVVTQKPEMHGPPQYFTIDWRAAEKSVALLASLEPSIVITGHGRAMQGAQMREALSQLSREFTKVAIPGDGRYVSHPAYAEDGSAYVHRSGGGS
jgi:glyoxylase-like metal-dependent hydrolase (beta-lactamase superfamily II)